MSDQGARFCLIFRPACNRFRGWEVGLGTKQVSVADVDLEVFERGTGRPVLFLHCGEGFQSDAPFVAKLADEARLIAPSHPGFGRSSLPDWIDRIEDIPHVY